MDATRRKGKITAPNPARPRRTIPGLAVAALAALTAFAVYVFTLHPSVPAGDSGELITAAWTLGVAHPPGYPLYTLLAHAFASLLPWGEVAFRMNLLSAILHAITVGVVAMTLLTLRAGTAGALAGALALAFAGPFWKYALVAEVFPLNSLFAALLLLGFASFLRDAGLVGARPATPARPWPLALLLFVTALIPAHHHSLLLLALPLDAVVALMCVSPESAIRRLVPGAHRPYRLTKVHLAIGAGLVIAGLAPLLHLPLAAARDPAIDWGDPETSGRFLHLLLRRDYGTFQLDPDATRGASAARHLTRYFPAILRDFGIPAAMLAIAGVAGLAATALGRKPTEEAPSPGGARALGAVLVGFALLQGAFLASITFPAVPATYLGVVERFHILPHLVLAILVGLGTSFALRFARGARPVAAALVVALSAGVPLATNFAVANQRGNTFTRDLAYDILASLPPNAVLFTSGDLFFTSLSYATIVERRRPDVVCLDQELMLYPWYVAAVRRRHPGILPAFGAGEDDRYTSAPATGNVHWIDHLRGGRPIAFLGSKEKSFEERYEFVRRGFVFVPHARGAVPTRQQELEATLALLPGFRTDAFFRSYDPWSFEAGNRALLADLLRRTTLLLCLPEGQALSPERNAGVSEVGRVLDRYLREVPNPDAGLLRSSGLLHIYHPSFRDLPRARQELEQYLASGVTGREAEEARNALRAIAP